MPYTSNDIAMAISQQNQGFMQGAHMANVMGMPGVPPAMMGGPQPFNQGGYDPTAMTGMTGANVGRVGTAATLGMLPSLPSMMGVVGGVAGGLMGKSWARPLQMFDPFSMGIGGYQAGGVLGGLAGAGLSLGAGAAVSWGAQQMYRGAVDYQRTGAILNQTLGRTFQPAEMAYTGGEGFTATQKRQMSALMRRMEYIPELMTSTDELQRLLVKMEQTGMFSGAVGVTEIGRRFKDGIKTIRTLASIMGTTMEEALPLFQEARTTGFFTASDILKNAVNRQVVAGTLGFTQNQVGAVSAAGAAMVTQLGGSARGAGALGAQRGLGQIGMARRMGLVTEQEVAAATGGQTGTQGAVALQQQFMQAGMQLAQSGMGRLVAAASAEVGEGGRLTGRLRGDVLEQLRGGNIGRGELMRMARENVRGRRGQFAMMEEELTSQLAASGPQSIVAVLRSAIDQRGAWGEDLEQVVGHILRSYTNLAKPARDLLIRMTRESGQIQREMNTQQRQRIESLKIKELYRTRSLGYRWEQLKTEIGQYTTEPLRGAGETISYGFERLGEEANRWLTGVDVTNVSALGERGIRTGLATGATNVLGGARGGEALNQRILAPGVGEADFWGDSTAANLSASARLFGLQTQLGRGEAGVVTGVGGAGAVGITPEAMRRAGSSELLSRTKDLESLASAKRLSGQQKSRLRTLVRKIGRTTRVEGEDLAEMTMQEKARFFEQRFGRDLAAIGGDINLGEVLRVAEMEEGLTGMRGWTDTENMLASVASAGAAGMLRDAAETKTEAIDVAEAMFRSGGVSGESLSATRKFMQEEAVGAGRLMKAAQQGELDEITKLVHRRNRFEEMTDAERDKLTRFGVTGDNYARAAEFIKGLEKVQHTRGLLQQGETMAALGQSIFAPLLESGMQAYGGMGGIGETLAGAGQAEAQRATRRRMVETAQELTAGMGTRAGAGILGRGIDLTSLTEQLRTGQGAEALGTAEDIMMRISSMGRDRTDVIKALQGMGGAGEGLAAGAMAARSIGQMRGPRTIAALGTKGMIGEERAAELAGALGIETASGKPLSKEDAETLTRAIVKEVFSTGVTQKGALAAFDTRTQYEQNFMTMLNSMKSGADAMNAFVSTVDRVIPNWKDQVSNLNKETGPSEALAGL